MRNDEQMQATAAKAAFTLFVNTTNKERKKMFFLFVVEMRTNLHSSTNCMSQHKITKRTNKFLSGHSTENKEEFHS
jgi:hypothetical protein